MHTYTQTHRHTHTQPNSGMYEISCAEWWVKGYRQVNATHIRISINYQQKNSWHWTSCRRVTIQKISNDDDKITHINQQTNGYRNLKNIFKRDK